MREFRYIKIQVHGHKLRTENKDDNHSQRDTITYKIWIKELRQKKRTNKQTNHWQYELLQKNFGVTYSAPSGYEWPASLPE